jgi:hypothetical protein
VHNTIYKFSGPNYAKVRVPETPTTSNHKRIKEHLLKIKDEIKI